MNIEYDINLKQKVKIIPFNIKGHIEGIFYSYYGIKYYVCFY